MKHILVPLDGSEHALKALDIALDLVGDGGGKLTLLHVTPSRDIPQALRRFAEVEHMEGGAEWLYDRTVGERILQDAEQRAGERRPADIAVSVLCGDPADTICNSARSAGCDAVVMGSRGLSELGGLVLGSVSRKVAHGEPCTVIIVH